MAHKNTPGLKIMMLLIVFTMAISCISAWEFDNQKTYDSINKEVTITNSLLGIPTSDVATAKLITPQVYYVMPGQNRKVAEFEINLLTDSYEDAFKQLDLYNNKDGKKIDRDITIKYKTIIPYEVEVEDYKEVCVEDINGTNCYQELTGTHKEERTKEEWTPIEKLYLTKGKVTIGLFTDVYNGDNVEWIPTLFGIEIPEWSTWTSSLTVGLVAYWNMSSAKENVYGIYNLTANEGTMQYNTTDCLIGGCGQFFDGKNVKTPTQNALVLNGTSTMNFWVYDKGVLTADITYMNVNEGTGMVIAHRDGAGSQKWYFRDNIIGIQPAYTSPTGKGWFMITITVNGTGEDRCIFINGTMKGCGNGNAFGSNNYWEFGAWGTNEDLSGLIDEVGYWNRTLTPTEVSDLYNGGAGITYDTTTGSTAPTMSVTLTSPTDNLNTTKRTQWFSESSTATYANITNLTLQIWSGTTQALVYSNYSVSGGTSNTTNLSMRLAVGNYTWNYYGCAANNTASLCSYGTNRTLRISNPVFGLCNSTNTVQFLNYSFKDSSTSSLMNATFTSTWTIYDASDSSSNTQAYSYTSTVENASYSFCGRLDSGTLSVSPSIQYSASGYPARTYDANYFNITNATTNTTLYLLASADGIYQTIIVSDGAGSAIEDALVIATYGGITYDSKETDSSGSAQLWLDADLTYTLTTSKADYPTDVRSLNPSSTTVYITLGTTPEFKQNLSYSYLEGITYSFEPTNTTLYNRTAYDFKFIVSSSYWTISSFGFTLYNTTDAIGSSNATTSGGTATLNYNVLNNTKIRMVGYWVINGTTIKVSKDWNVMNSADTDYSLLFLGRRIKTYLASGFFGLTPGFNLNIIIFIVILFTTGIISYKFGIGNPIAITLIATFLVGLFEFGLGLLQSDSWMPITAWAVIVLIGVAIKEGLT